MLAFCSLWARFPVAFRLDAAEFVTVLCLSTGVSSKETNVGCGGTVYLRCTLSPFVCCDGNETFDDEVTACATFQQVGYLKILVRMANLLGY